MSYHRLKNLVEPELEGSGFTLTADDYDPASFGSGCCVYSRGRLRIRMVWDGKESSARVEYASAPSADWRDIESVVPRRAVIRGDADESDRFEDLRGVVANWLVSLG